MEVTFYSNCRLSKSYNEVIHHNYLDAYLNTLSKTTINLSNVYVSSNGRLPIELLPLGINYLEGNYMKVVDNVNQITRYFFIDSLDIINGVAVANYSEDIWANYAHKINIAKGNISNLRYGIGNNLRNLPNEYLSNDKLNLTPIDTTESLNKQFNILVTLQLYNLGQSDEVIERQFASFIIGLPSGSSIGNYNFANAEYHIKEIIQFMSNPDNLKVQVLSTTPEFKCYDIMDALILPKEYIDNLNLEYNEQITYSIYPKNTSSSPFIYLKRIRNDIYSYHKSIANNYKRYAIGCIDNYVVTDNNGSNIDFDYNLIIDDNNIELLLKVGTSIINVTKSFTYEFPVNVQDASVTQQQKIARAVANYQLDINRSETIAKGASNIAFGAMDAIVGGIQGSMGDIRGVGKIASGAQAIVNSSIDLAFGLEKNDLKKWAVNYKAYKSSTSIHTNSILMLNCNYGFISFEVVPDNETYINQLIETIGYATLMIVSDNSLIESKQENQDYNIVKFSSVWIYGNVTHDIQLILETILEKGIKIWFKSELNV